MTSRAQDELLRANLCFYEAIGSGDIEGMDALWSDRAPVACVHPGWPALHGRDEVMSSWRSILLGPAPPKILCLAPHASVLGDVGHVVCREQLGDQTLVATNLFVREQQLWMMVHHHAGPLADWGVPQPPSTLVN